MSQPMTMTTTSADTTVDKGVLKSQFSRPSYSTSTVSSSSVSSLPSSTSTSSSSSSATSTTGRPLQHEFTNEDFADAKTYMHSYYAKAVSDVDLNRWTPVTSLTGLGNVDFGAERTHFTNNVTNYGSQIYQVGQAFNNVLTKDIPSSWLTQGSATQFNLLNEADLHYAANVIQELVLNPPSMPPSIVSQVVPDLTLSQGTSGDPTSFSSSSSFQRNNDNNRASIERSFDVGKAAEGVFAAKKGFDLASKFWGVANDAEASEAFGSSVMEGVEGLAEGAVGGAFEAVGMEGVIGGGIAAVTEAVGGAAVVGATVAGAEVLAGVAVVGLGIYEAYRAFGGSKDLSDLSSGLSSAMKFGESVGGWFP